MKRFGDGRRAWAVKGGKTEEKSLCLIDVEGKLECPEGWTRLKFDHLVPAVGNAGAWLVNEWGGRGDDNVRWVDSSGGGVVFKLNVDVPLPSGKFSFASESKDGGYLWAYVVGDTLADSVWQLFPDGRWVAAVESVPKRFNGGEMSYVLRAPVIHPLVREMFDRLGLPGRARA